MLVQESEDLRARADRVKEVTEEARLLGLTVGSGVLMGSVVPRMAAAQPAAMMKSVAATTTTTTTGAAPKAANAPPTAAEKPMSGGSPEATAKPKAAANQFLAQILARGGESRTKQ
jgi:hydroxyethylthiazole kinase-like sugar kinase family protein